ncbi:MAG: M55 family metallopeptidase [Bacteroidales bacterium]|jgi:D-amino peptidase
MKKPIKVMIGVDFEGASGVVVFDEIYAGHVHFDRNCKELTYEVNAAIEGAMEAGATEFIVRDGHGGNINVDPTILNPVADLGRGRKPMCAETMVYGIDESYDALMFIGAHAKACDPRGVLSHTMGLNVLDLTINGVSLSEQAYNGLWAAQFGVPVVLVSGDDVTCTASKEEFGENVETAETKVAICRTAAYNHSPKRVYDTIKKAAYNAIKNLDKMKPYDKIIGPKYDMVLKLKGDNEGNVVTVEYSSTNLLDLLTKFWSYI